MVVRSLASTRHPITAHLIPIRRCNLSCAYCNEYDKDSPPVGTRALFRRIDRLGELGTGVITLSGGEPLLHPDADDIIARIRQRRAIAGLITNGYLLTRDRIERLNRAGLDHLQISIDNVQPDDVSMKSLKVLDRKLELLSEYATFHVNINSVFGAGVRRPEDALTVARRAMALGLASTIGVIHDSSGQLQPLNGYERGLYDELSALSQSSFGRINRYNPYQRNLISGKPNNWWVCRAGGRYLYICEDGLVHYCSQQRGYPGIPLEDYTPADIRREYLTKKSCAPYCTISCVHQTSIVDRWRDPQTLEFDPAGELVQIRAAGKV